MPLLVFNKTTSPVNLAVTGIFNQPIPAGPSPGVRGPGVNVTTELRPKTTVDPINGTQNGLTAAQYATLQTQVASNTLDYEWTDAPGYSTATLFCLSVFALRADEAAQNAALTELLTYADDLASPFILHVDALSGSDSNTGLSTAAPLQTLAAALAKIPMMYKTGAPQIHLMAPGVGPSAGSGNPMDNPYSWPSTNVRLPRAIGTTARKLMIFADNAGSGSGATTPWTNFAPVYTGTAVAGSFSAQFIKVASPITLTNVFGGIIFPLTGPNAGQYRQVRGLADGNLQIFCNTSMVNMTNPGRPTRVMLAGETFAVLTPRVTIKFPTGTTNIVDDLDFVNVRLETGTSGSLVLTNEAQIGCVNTEVEVRNGANLVISQRATMRSGNGELAPFGMVAPIVGSAGDFRAGAYIKHTPNYPAATTTFDNTNFVNIVNGTFTSDFGFATRKMIWFASGGASINSLSSTWLNCYVDTFGATLALGGARMINYPIQQATAPTLPIITSVSPTSVTLTAPAAGVGAGTNSTLIVGHGLATEEAVRVLSVSGLTYTLATPGLVNSHFAGEPVRGDTYQLGNAGGFINVGVGSRLSLAGQAARFFNKDVPDSRYSAYGSGVPVRAQGCHAIAVREGGYYDAWGTTPATATDVVGLVDAYAKPRGFGISGNNGCDIAHPVTVTNALISAVLGPLRVGAVELTSAQLATMSYEFNEMKDQFVPTTDGQGLLNSLSATVERTPTGNYYGTRKV